MSWSFPTIVAVAVGSSIFTLPFTSAFTRAGTTYAPVGLHDKSDGTLIQQVGLRTSPWAQLKSAWLSRGVRGLFQGLYLKLPVLLLDSLAAVAESKYLYPRLPALASHLQVGRLLSLVYLPLEILSSTVTVDPRLETWNPIEAVCRLSAGEEGGLWSLWTSRRYLQARMVDLVLAIVVESLGHANLKLCEWSLAVFTGENASGKSTFNTVGFFATVWGVQAVVLAAVAGLGLALTVVQSRLEVSSGAYLSSPTHDKEADSIATDASLKVVLRSRPYTGVWDCVTSVVREEGWQALFRGAKEGAWLGVGLAGIVALAGFSGRYRQ